MARHCRICTHADREQIDRALLGSEGQIAIAARYGIAQSSVSRHLRLHLAPTIANRLGRYEDIDVERLRSWGTGLLEEALLGAVKARNAGDAVQHRAYLGEARKAVELLAKLAGVLDSQPQISVDARRQVAVLANLTEEELREALVGAASEPAATLVIAPATVPVIESVPVAR